MDTRALVFLALVAAASAVPISQQESEKCSTTCTDSSKFRFATGNTYTYDYRVDTDTSVAGASEDQAKLTLQTVGDIEVLSPCEFSLRLRNTRLFHTDGSGSMKTADREVQFRTALEAHPLRFSFQDGVVEHTCPSEGDDAWTMNLKKGFLSAFQNSMDDITQSQNVTETDVVGTCKTEYTVVSNGYYTTTLKKEKNILSCTNRHNYETIIQTSPYFIQSDIQSLPLMKTTHECEQSVEVGGVLKSTTCTEVHVYRPFANGMSGGKTTVTQKLTYQTYRNSISSRPVPIGSRDTLVFDYTATQPNKEQARRSVEQKLGAICDTTILDLRPETPRLFSDLVLAMKSMGSDDMEDLYRLLKTKTICPKNGRAYKLFLDALPMTNTRNSVRLMSKLIINEDVEGLQAKAWLTSLAFIPAPTSDMILDVKGLIDSQKLRSDAMLPVSSLINNFCKQQTSCDQDYNVLSIMSSLERTIGYRCDASGKSFEKILLTLRAIGNAGHASRAIKVLSKCMTNTNNPMEVRIAAIEAFRRMPCESEDKGLWNLLLDTSLDSELRISSYLALMRCPSQKTLVNMADLLVKEDNEQVGAFIYSHLTNLRESSNPHKQEVARMIDNMALDKEFDLSPLKYSRNYEISTLINKLNTGFTAESNVIWSSSEQLPRYVSGNLTVELFGQSVNILDFGGRLEGLEYLLKNVFAPYVSADMKAEKDVDFDKIHGSIFGRVFGNEMLFINTKTAQSPFGKLPEKWLDVLIKLSKKQEIALTNAFQFLDSCMVIPSAAGLPVQIHVNGSAVVDLSVSGKMDLRKIGASPRSMDIDGEIRPSASLEVTGTMAVDAFVTKTGLHMRNTMHSSTSMKGRIQLNRGQQLNVELDTPDEKMEIFEAKSQFFIHHNGIDQEQKMITDNKKEYEVCSGSKMATITGMELCGQISFPNASMKADGPYFPLTGPSSVSVILHKRDTHSGYKLFAKRVQNKKASIAQCSVNTPGSKVDRAITVDMSLNYNKKMIEMNLFSPWKKTEIKGNLINQDGMKSIAGRLVVDDVNVYAVTAEVKTLIEKKKIQYSPMIEIKRPGADNIQLIGLIAIERPLKSLNVDMSLTGIQKLPYTFKSTLTNTKKEMSVFASFSNDNKNFYSVEASNQVSIMGKKATIATLKTKFNVNTPSKQLVAFYGSADYREDRSLKMDSSVEIYRLLKKPASFKVNLVKNAKKKGSRYDLDAILKSSKIGVRIDSNLFIKPSGFVSTKLSLDYTIPKVNRNKIIFSGKLNDRSTKSYKKYSIRGNLGVKRNPEYNMGLILDLDHKKKHSEIELDLKYGPNPKDKTKKIYFLTSLTKKISNLKNALVNYKIKAQAPAHEVNVFLGGKHVHTPKMVDSKVELNYGKNKNINAAVLLRDKSAKLTKLNGKMNVEWPGKAYVLSTQLAQKSAKQYSHDLTIKGKDGTRHTMTTIYKMPKSATHDITTSMRIHGQKPLTLSGSTTLNKRNFQASGKVISGRNTYGISTSSKITKTPNAKINIEVIHPARRMTLDVNGGKIKNKYEAAIEAAWNADEKDSRVAMKGAYLRKSSKGTVSQSGNINLKSPFANFEDLLLAINYGSDAKEHNVDSKFSWGGKGQQITSNLNVKRNFNLNNIDMNVAFKTPFKGFRNAQVSIDHNLEKTLNTVIKGNVEKENAKLVLQGQDQSDSQKTDIKGNLALRSTLKNAKVITADFAHSFGAGKLITSANLKQNGQKYEGKVNMFHTANGWQIKNNGDVIVKTPQTKVSAKWAHKNSDKAMKCNLISSWGGKALKVDFSGSHELSNLRKLNADLQVRAPWDAARNIEISLDHKHGNGLLQSNTLLNQNGKTKLSSKINFNGGEAASDFDFELKTPMCDDLRGKISAQYDKYPMTSSATLTWAPKKKVTIDGSLNLASWENSNVNMKITTPFGQYRNIMAKASNTKANDEMISHIILDYGVRQSIDLESRLSLGQQKKLVRVKLLTPFTQMKSLDTGFTFDGNLNKFDSRADFEVLPSLGKLETIANWQYDNEMSGKIRVNTPFKDYPYFEISTSSVLKGASRQSQAQLQYHPSKSFSFDSVYTFNFPLSIEATIRSPFPQYDNLGIAIRHNHGDSFIFSHGEITYQPGATIEGDLKADWSSNIEGSLAVKTPFKDFESNQISFRHKGIKSSISSHGEIFIGLKKIVADASVKSGYSTSATITFSSPIPGMEKLKLMLKKKGDIDNIKGGINLMINKDKIQLNFNNKLSKSSLKSGLNLMTPYSETLKLALDHNGPVENFVNKMSLNYGRKVDIDTITSFDLRESDINGNALLKYKTGKIRNTARLTLKKSGPLDDMSFSTTASFNKDDVTIAGSWKTVGEIDGSVSIKTPFQSFKSTGMTLTHKGGLADFQSNININYMDNKNIYGKVEFSNLDGKKVKLVSQLATPFKSLKTSSLELNNEINELSDQISGNVILTTTLNDFGTGSIVYSKSGDLNNLKIDTNVMNNGKDMASLVITNNFNRDELHSKFSLKTALTPTLLLTVDHLRDEFSLNTNTLATFGESTVSSEANMKKGYQSIDADGLILVKLAGHDEKKGSLNVHSDGDWNRCNLRITGTLTDEHEVKLTVSKKGDLQDMSFDGSASYNGESINVVGSWKNGDTIDGQLEIKTPFDDFHNIGVTLAHSGDIFRFSSSATLNYMDNKKVTGTVDVTANSLDKIRVNLHLITPLRTIRYVDVKFNHDYDRYTNDVSGDIALSTSVAGLGTKSVRYSKTGILKNLKVEIVSTDNGVEQSSLKMSNRLYGNELHSSMDFKSTYLPSLLLAVDHKGDLYDLKTVAKAQFGRNNVITGDATLNVRGNVIDGEGKFTYDIESLGQKSGSVKVHKDGESDDINVSVTISVDGHISKLVGNFKNTDELSMALSLNTPFENYKDVGLSLKHSGNLERFNCDGKIELMDGMVFTGKINFYRYLYRRIETVVEVTTPYTDYEFTKLEYRHEGNQDSFKCSSTLEYGDSKKVVYDLNISTSPIFDYTIALKTPSGVVSSSGSVEYTWPKYAIKGTINGKEGRVLTIDGSLDASNNVIGSLSISTPIERFTDVGLGFTYSPKHSGLETNGYITYIDGKTISGKTDIDFANTGRLQMSAELRTPFVGYEFTKYEQLQIVNKKLLKSTMTFTYGNGKTIVYEIYRAFKPRPEIHISLKTPFKNYENMMASLSVDNTWPKYGLKSNVNAGNDKLYSLTGAVDISGDISGTLNVATPHQGFTDIGLSFLHSGNKEKFDTEGRVTYMDGKDIGGKVSFYKYLWRRIVVSTELNTPFAGMEKTKAEVNFEDNSNSISTTAALEYGNGDKLNGNVKFTYSPNYDAMITLNTPFNGYKLIRAHGSLDMTAPTYEMTYSLDGGYTKLYSATGKLNLYSVNNVDASLEMNTPVSDYEYTKAEYMHKFDANQIDGSISLIYMNGQKVGAELKTSLAPNFDTMLTIKTPFIDYEDLQASALFEKSYNRYEASSSLNLGKGQVYSVSSDIDWSSIPMKASAKVNTPFTDFSQMELSLTHDGEINNFVSTAHFTSSLTDDINARASLRYDSLFDLMAAASLQSSLEGFDDLKSEIKMSDAADEKKSHFLLGWTSGQEVIVDSIYKKQQSWYENKVNTELSISTPFQAVRSMALQMEVTEREDGYNEKTTVELNGDSLLDLDAEYKSKDKHEIQINIRQPWPMVYTAALSKDAETTDAEILLNWNRNEQDATIRMQTVLTDKSNDYQTDNSIDVKMTLPSREVGIFHKINVDSSQTGSSGHIYWDTDVNSKLSYELQLSETTRRRKQIRDGSFKLGLPSRTLGLTTAFSDNQVAKAADITFSWDADKDDSKQVGVKATVNRGESLKGDITLSLPSLSKEIRVDGEVMLKNGRIIFDAKTDYSYSQDSRKTLTLTSKLEDVSDYYSNYNYSLSLGVRHLYTNVDMTISSHIGSSNERTTFGMDTKYLTSKKQMKNLALLTEINKLKKQINMQVNGPTNKIEINGGVVSTTPYKVRLQNKKNDVETFRSDVTYDEKKKSFVFNAYMDSDRLTVSAKYPNSSAFQAEVINATQFDLHIESLFAARLNTSRLLHTRFHWCPKLMGELRTIFLVNAVEDALKLKMALKELNEAVRDEISAKYIAIADEFHGELGPFIVAMNKELSIIGTKMEDLSRHLRVMYQRNDFYIQDMGAEFNEYYMMLQEKLEKLIQVYRINKQELTQSMTRSLTELKNYPIREKYTKMVDGSAMWLNNQVIQSLTWIENVLADLDKTIEQFKAKASNISVPNYLTNRISQVQNSVSPYISSFKIPENYTNAIYDFHNSVFSKVNDFLERSEAEYLKERSNEVYQQAKWAYNYWQVEENIRKHAHSILETLKEIIQEELKEMTQELHFVTNNPITVWDPEHGEIQADIPLPIAIKRLDQVPDFSPFVKKAEKMASLYLPDKTTWNKFVKSVSEMTPAQEKTLILKKSSAGRQNRAVVKSKKGRKFRMRISKQ